MSEKFRNKYRTTTFRLANWDYGNKASYFVTICPKNREFYFGNIVDGKMQMTEIGEIAMSEWFKTVEIRKDMNLEVGEFVVMPNHIHGIITIGDNRYNNPIEMHCRDTMHCVSTDKKSTGKPSNDDYKNQFGPQSKNLASIMRGYKSSVTKHARMKNIEFNWQSKFYEHIIRTEKAFHAISKYIVNNPKKWEEDTFK